MKWSVVVKEMVLFFVFLVVGIAWLSPVHAMKKLKKTNKLLSAQVDQVIVQRMREILFGLCDLSKEETQDEKNKRFRDVAEKLELFIAQQDDRDGAYKLFKKNIALLGLESQVRMLKEVAVYELIFMPDTAVLAEKYLNDEAAGRILQRVKDFCRQYLLIQCVEDEALHDSQFGGQMFLSEGADDLRLNFEHFGSPIFAEEERETQQEEEQFFDQESMRMCILLDDLLRQDDCEEKKMCAEKLERFIVDQQDLRKMYVIFRENVARLGLAGRVEELKNFAITGELFSFFYDEVESVEKGEKSEYPKFLFFCKKYEQEQNVKMERLVKLGKSKKNKCEEKSKKKKKKKDGEAKILKKVIPGGLRFCGQVGGGVRLKKKN